jgi:hypothetical protein
MTTGKPNLLERLRQRLSRAVPTREDLAKNRWLRWLGPSLLHPKVWQFSRRGVATGVAIGVFFAFITPVAQIPLSAAVSVLLRANVPSAVVATLVNTPPTFGPVYYAAWKVGAWVLQEPTDEASEPALLKGLPGASSAVSAASGSGDGAAPAPADGGSAGLWGTATSVGKPLLVGTLIFAVGFSALSWMLVSVVWQWRVKRKRLQRTAGR